MIKAAAIKINNEVFSLPQPNRHHDIIRYLVEKVGKPKPIGGIQGFIDDAGNFFDRDDSFKIAKKLKQIKNGKIIGGVLTSEDLW